MLQGHSRIRLSLRSRCPKANYWLLLQAQVSRGGNADDFNASKPLNVRHHGSGQLITRLDFTANFFLWAVY